MSLTEAQDALNVSRNTVRRLVDRGELPVVKIGRRRMVTPAALTELISANTTGDTNT